MLTLALDAASQERFEAERQRWFPVERNVIPAHLTLFHTLPEDENTTALLRDVAAGQCCFAMTVRQVRSIGRGVAYFMESADAVGLHRRLSASFEECLSAQDRQGFRPHVVVQNKASAEQVREALAVLQAAFGPWDVEGVGLDLWRYLGGPWQHLERFAFSAA